MIDTGDVFFEPDAEQVAEQGHKGLEASEVDSGCAAFAQACFGDAQALADGYGESIHRQAHGQYKQFR